MRSETLRVGRGKQWFALLKKDKAGDLSHKEIAAKLYKEYGVSGWWAQSITVEFERAIGRREIGQTCNGDFQAGATKTLAGSMDDVVKIWQKTSVVEPSLTAWLWKTSQASPKLKSGATGASAFQME